MNYDFIRKLAVKVSDEKAGAIIQLLLSHNIETYAEGTLEEKKEGTLYVNTVGNVAKLSEIGEESRILPNGNLYVAAADRAHAIEFLEENGYGNFVCRDEQEAAVLSETEKAMQEYYRKRKQNNLITLVIVVVVFLFLFLRGIVG